jgi:hypothetical protein
MLFKEAFAVYGENHTIHTYTKMQGFWLLKQVVHIYLPQGFEELSSHTFVSYIMCEACPSYRAVWGEAWTLRSWVRILLKELKFVLVILCCVVLCR